MKTDYKQDIAFECSICADDKAAKTPRVELDGDSVCKECYLETIKPKFHAALEDISHWPVSWAKTQLSPEQLPGFTQAFKKQWNARVEVYKLPEAEKVVCQHLSVYDAQTNAWRAAGQIVYEKARREGTTTGTCGQIVGRATSGKGISTRKCDRCQGIVCMHCGLALYPLLRTGEHDCDPENVKKEPEVDPSLRRGVDYQNCPNPSCPERWGLDSGCNSIVCKCGTHFCFICGIKAHHDSDHWTQGSCPRWNQPGTARAHHDAVEEPLVIHPDFLGVAERARADAEDAGSELLRQEHLDHAIGMELTGEILARAARAQEAHMEGAGVVWNRNWYEAAENALDACMNGRSLWARLNALTDPNELAMLHTTDVLVFLSDAQQYREDHLHIVLDFLENHPAEADFLGGGEMRLLFERMTKLVLGIEDAARTWLKEYQGGKVPTPSKKLA